MNAIDLSPFGDNVLYEEVFDRQDEDLLIQEYTDFPRQGIQITGGARHNESIAFARRMKAALVRAGLPTVVFYRFSVDDNVHGHWVNGRWEEKMTPSFAAAWLADIAQGGLVPSYNNEPNAGTLEDIANHARETLIYLTERKAPPVVMLNWHTGFIENLENRYGGEFDEVYRLMERRGDWAGFHGYMNTCFLDNAENPLYIGRHRYIVPATKFPRLKKVYTEFGFDSHAPNPQYDGYQNHKELWARIFPGKDPIDVYWDEAVKADEAILAPENIIVLWFCRYHNGTPRWTAFNYAGEAELIRRMKTYRRKPMSTKIPAPTEGGRRVRITGFPTGITRRNIRDQPTDIALDLTPNELDLQVGDEVLLYLDSPHDNWLYVDRGDVKGWVLFSGVQYAFMDTPTSAPPDGLYIPFSADELNQLASLHSSIAASCRVQASTHDEIATLYRSKLPQ